MDQRDRILASEGGSMNEPLNTHKELQITSPSNYQAL